VPVRSYELPSTVGAIAPVAGDAGWLLAAGRGFARLSPDGSVHPLARVAPEWARMNDAACDPHGRMWAGTMAHDHRRGGGALFRLDGDGQVTFVLDGLTISNGLDWSPDGATMYLADSGRGAVHAFAFDGERGTISDERVLVAMDEEVGTPDGMTVDAAGDLWVAIWGGGRIHRYAPDGELRQALAVPTPLCTCCAFAGPGLHRLYLTTAAGGRTDAARRADPNAGLVYRLDTDATGVPAAPFRPDPAWWTGAT
jgi:sugar lactone lactonase YvrE